MTSYWYLTLNSLWAAQASSYRTVNHDAKSEWIVVGLRIRNRNRGTVITLVLAIVFNTLQVQSDRWDWDICTGGCKCYRSHDRSTWRSELLWLAGLSLMAITLALKMTTVGGNWVKSVFNRLDERRNLQAGNGDIPSAERGLSLYL